MVFVGMVMVVVVPVVVSLMVMVVIVIMGGFIGIGLSHRLIQTAMAAGRSLTIAHLHIDNQRQGYLAMLSVENFDIFSIIAKSRFYSFEAFWRY